jgi:protein phosphatase
MPGSESQFSICSPYSSLRCGVQSLCSKVLLTISDSDGSLGKVNLTIPDLSLVVLMGPSGSGKSTFARKHFRPSEVLSSDFCRYLVSDDENNQAATNDAFEVLRFIAGKRLAAAKLTVIDATNVQRESRKPLVALAVQYGVLPVAIVLNVPEYICLARNRHRPDRTLDEQVIRNQWQDLRQSFEGLEHEGFGHVHILDRPDQIESVAIDAKPAP